MRFCLLPRAETGKTLTPEESGSLSHDSRRNIFQNNCINPRKHVFLQRGCDTIWRS